MTALTACSAKFLKPTVTIPNEPEYTQINFFLCNATEVDRAVLTIQAGDSFLAYCLSEEDLKALISNVLLMKGYIEELKVLIHGTANVEEDEGDE